MRRGGLPSALRSPMGELPKMASAAIPRLRPLSLRVAVRRSAPITDVTSLAAEKEPATQLLVRLVDRDVRAGHPRVPDEKSRGREPAKSSTDDVCPHRLSPGLCGGALKPITT